MVSAVASIGSILMLIIVIVGSIPSVPLDVKVRVIVYIGILLALVGGGAAIIYIQEWIGRIILGVVFWLIIMALIESLPKLVAG